ncbi:hypothetical protein GCM10023156_40410 [Novipirellula rosea]|uniref:Uncharacterized protein n=2 Tax=Novipirellula rosea TaxID=1031540 RepID=A0ABP8N6A8_9BACT
MWVMKPAYEPIRKPAAAQPRGVCLIRLLTGRVVQWRDGSLHAVVSAIDPYQLQHALLRWSQAGRPSKFTRETLPIPAGALARVSRDELHLASSALASLSKRELQKRTRLSREQCRCRLDQLRAALDRNDMSPSASSADEWHLFSWGQNSISDSACSWQSLVHWLGDDRGLKSWCETMASLEGHRRRPEWWNLARRCVAILAQLESEFSELDVHERMRRSHLAFMLAIELAKKPYELDIQITYPDRMLSRKRGQKWVVQLRRSIQTQMETVEVWNAHRVPAVLASWVSISSSRSFDRAPILRWLSKRRGYSINTLLQMAGELSHSEFRKLLSFEKWLDDVPEDRWCGLAKSKLPHHTLQTTLEKGCFYRLHRRHDDREMWNAIYELTGRYFSAEGHRVVGGVYRTWYRWAKTWPSSCWKSDRADRWIALLSNMNDLVVLNPALLRRFSGWLDSMQRESERSQIDIDPISRTDALTQLAARRLRIYRGADGHETKWPRSIASRLELRAKWQREFEYLEQSERAESLNARSQQRLDHLRNTPSPRLPKIKSLRLRIRRAGLSASHDAAKTWLFQRQREYFLSLGVSPATLAIDLGTPSDRLGDFLTLLATLPLASRNLLLQGLRRTRDQEACFRRVGYKHSGRANQDWMQKAEKAGINLAAWFTDHAVEVSMAAAPEAASQAKPLKIRVTGAAEYLLWMGRPFGSCLDLRGGAYCESVVPNFLDANKQLIVLLDHDGHMVGRKLVAISRDSKLLGYYLYLETSGEHEWARNQVTAAVNQFCRTWATAIGIELAVIGNPTTLHGNSWYDDGPESWEQPESAAENR